MSGTSPNGNIFVSVSDVVSRYGAVAVGLLLGTLAKYGLALTDNKNPTWKTLLADLLIVGALTVIVVAVSDWLNLTSNMKVAMGVMVGISADRLLRLARTKFEHWIAAKVEAAMPPAPAVPPAQPAATEVVRLVIGGPLPAPDAEIDALVQQIHDPETRP